MTDVDMGALRSDRDAAFAVLRAAGVKGAYPTLADAVRQLAQIALSERQSAEALEERVAELEQVRAPAARGVDDARDLMHMIQTCNEADGPDGLCECARAIAERFDDYIRNVGENAAIACAFKKALDDLRVAAVEYLHLTNIVPPAMESAPRAMFRAAVAAAAAGADPGAFARLLGAWQDVERVGRKYVRDDDADAVSYAKRFAAEMVAALGCVDAARKAMDASP